MAIVTTATAAFFVISGTVLNITGIVCAARTLCDAWVSYGHGPLWPWATRQKRKLSDVARRIKFRSKKSAEIHTLSARASSKSSASIRLTIRKGLVFDEGTTDAEKIIKLVEAIKYIYEELDENRQHADGKYDTLIKLLNDTTNRLNSESKRLEALSKEIATGDVRPQLISILLIGFGTLLAAIPTICALFF
jgi:hypothetical protein